MMYHITRQAVDRLYYQRVFVCSGDTDVFVSLMFHFETQWKRKQINELWVVHGDRMSPVHKAISSLDPSLAYILPAVHDFTSCDKMTQDSKFEPWRSEAEHATSRSRRLPTILTHRL